MNIWFSFWYLFWRISNSDFYIWSEKYLILILIFVLKNIRFLFWYLFWRVSDFDICSEVCQILILIFVLKHIWFCFDILFWRTGEKHKKVKELDNNETPEKLLTFLLFLEVKIPIQLRQNPLPVSTSSCFRETPTFYVTCRPDR